MTITEMRNRYGSLCAEIYDLDKPPGSLFDIAYYQGRLRDLEGQILEAGVGTGRMLVPLLEAGLTVEGFDHSPEMLAVCQTNLDQRGLSTHLKQARFQDFHYDHDFAAIIVPTSSFVLIDDFDEALDVLKRFRQHLRPGGLLLIDLPPMSFFEVKAQPRRWTAANGDQLTLVSAMERNDPIGQRRVNQDRYERWRDGKLIATEIELFAYRVWGLKEFELTLQAAGLVDLEVCSNYRSGRAPKSGDGILNFSARAPG